MHSLVNGPVNPPYEGAIQVLHGAIHDLRAIQASVNCPMHNPLNHPIMGQFIGPLVVAVHDFVNCAMNSPMKMDHDFVN